MTITALWNRITSITQLAAISSGPQRSEKKLSQQFAGWYYCNPCHNENYKVPDNFYGPKNFKTFTSWIQNNEIDLSREITYLKKWVNSKSFSYHSNTL